MRFFDPFREMDAVRREIDRALQGFVSRPATLRRPTFLGDRVGGINPLVNIWDDNDTIHVEALVPGVDPAKIDVQVHRDQLTISGERTTAIEDVRSEDYHRNERASGKFTRSFTLPVPVNADAVQAEYRNGVLLLTLPKSEDAKPRRIAIAAHN